MNLDPIGKAEHCSREYIRAWLYASAVVLAFHGKQLPAGVTIRIGELEEGLAGSWHGATKTISLDRALTQEDMATTILHECIHAACGNFGDNTDEKCCSTLTSRLKPEVHPIAHALAEGTYKRAAFLAHTKLSYVVDEDYYDQAEDRTLGVRDRHHDRRTEGQA